MTPHQHHRFTVKINRVKRLCFAILCLLIGFVGMKFGIAIYHLFR
jgi:hypothetical protein